MFKQRSKKTELLDEPDIPYPDLAQNLKELEVINKRLGGYSPIFRGLQKIIDDPSKTYHIVDIGSGGGDTLKAIADWGKRKKIKLRLTGVDLKPEAVDYAEKNCINHPEITFCIKDYRDYNFIENPTDIVVASLFCHHLNNKAFREFITHAAQKARLGVIINDLHRHPLAYYSIKWLAKVFSKSYLVKNDAPLSVLRGFKKQELLEIIRESGIKNNFSIRWMWAFRWLIVIRNNQHVR